MQTISRPTCYLSVCKYKKLHNTFMDYMCIKYDINYNIFVLEQAVGPGVLQTFSTCAVKQ